MARLAAVLPADPVEIEELLLDRRRAVLGVVPRLVYPATRASSGTRRTTGALPASCSPLNRSVQHWAIRGEIVELSR